MRAILLAAGLGTRLRPLTNNIPKCLVPIKGRPLLDIWLEKLTMSGVNEVLINTHYLAEQVQSFILGSKYRDNVKLVYEPTLLGTAGTLKANIDFFQGKDGMLIHADNYSMADLRDFQLSHERRPKEAIMTMMVFDTSDPENCGIVELNNKKIVTGFHEKVTNPPGNLANGAIYLLSAEMQDWVKKLPKEDCDFSNDVLAKLVTKINTYKTNEKHVDIGTVKNYYENC